MVEPELPFACGMPDCGMTFTNEDHLHVHTKKHDMVLQLGTEQKSAFVDDFLYTNLKIGQLKEKPGGVRSDQTPTPTRFIRNCEEVGLFQDLLNPFDEGFKRAMETKAGIQSLEAAVAGTSTDDVLHTPQMVFPLTDGDSTLYTSNNQRNITISRSSSDESGAVKEYETTTISKLTNEVTTISRIVGKQDILDKVTTTDDVSIVRHEDINKEINETVSYTNNVIKIHSNVEIRKDIETSKHIPRTLISYTDSVIKDAQVTKDVLEKAPDKAPPIMSQKSLDHVVDCLEEHNEKEKDCQLIKMLKRNYQNALKKPEAAKPKELIELDDFEIIIKKPDGKQVRMKPVEEDKRIQDETKERLKRVLSDKAEKRSQENPVQRIPNIETQIVQNLLPLATGTLVPVTLVNPNTILLTNNLQKIPIVPFNVNKVTGNYKKTVKRRVSNAQPLLDDDCVIVDGKNDVMDKKKMLESRTAASRRYRQRQKVTMHLQAEENKLLKETNQKLLAENAALKQMITDHLEKCTNPGILKSSQAEHHTNR